MSEKSVKSVKVGPKLEKIADIAKNKKIFIFQFHFG